MKTIPSFKQSLSLAAAILGLAFGASSASAGTIDFTSSFTGNTTTNWGWSSQNGSQLGGTDELTYTFNSTGNNTASYVSNTITNGATVFPGGTGKVETHLQVDLSNAPLGTPDYDVRSIASIWSSVGNQAYSGMYFTGFNDPGQRQFRFGSSASILYWSGGSSWQFGSVINLGSNTPSFALIYDLTMVTEITGNAAAWRLTTDLTVTGPMDADGTIGTYVVPQASYDLWTADVWGWNGWETAASYRVGYDGYEGPGITAGDSITFKTFSSGAAIPEPATWALLAGSLTTVMIFRRRRKA